jgi:hypothetical protein
MRIEGLVYPSFDDPELLKVSENPEPVVENGALFIHVKGKNGKRYRVFVSSLSGTRDGSKQLFERCIYAAGRFFEDSDLSKKEALTVFHHGVFQDWDYGKKK